MRAEWEALDREIRTVLTPEQARRYEELRREEVRRFQERMRQNRDGRDGDRREGRRIILRKPNSERPR